MANSTYTRDTFQQSAILQPCEWCGERRPLMARQLQIEHLGTLCYSICSVACGQALLEQALSRFVSSQRPAHLATIIKQELQIKEMVAIIARWKSLATIVLHVRKRYRPLYQELQDRTDAILNSVRGE